MDNLYSIAQLDRGFPYGSIPRIRAMEQYARMYAGDKNAILSEVRDNVVTGRSLIETTDIKNINIGDIVSGYYTDAIMGSGLIVSSEKEGEIDRYNNEIRARLIRVAYRALKKDSWGGLSGIEVYNDGTIVDLDPRELFIISPIEDNDETSIFVTFRPYYEPASENDAIQLPVTSHVANRATLEAWDPQTGQSIFWVCHFDGLVLGDVIEPPRPANIGAIVRIGHNDSFYPGIKDTWAAILIQSTIVQMMVNLDASRPEFYPASMEQAIEKWIPPAKEITGDDQHITDGRPTVLQGFQQNYYWWRQHRMPLAVMYSPEIGQTGTQHFGRQGEPYPIKETMDFLKYLYEEFALESGVAFSSFGYGIGAGESAEAREQAQTIAKARASTRRDQLLVALDVVARVLGYDVKHAFAAPPFVNSEQWAMLKDDEYERGITTLNEVREAKQYKPLEGGDVTKNNIGPDAKEATVVQPNQNDNPGNIQDNV